MRRSARFVAASFLVAAALAAAPRVASAQEGESARVGKAQDRGIKYDVGAALVLPLRGNGPYGTGATFDARYGIQVGPTVIAPGGRVAWYYISERGVATAMPMLRVTVPVGPLAPYLVGGIGWGGLTNDTESGLALLGGGGFLVHVGKVIAFGAEATYQSITGTELNTLMVMPVVSAADRLR